MFELDRIAKEAGAAWPATPGKKRLLVVAGLLALTLAGGVTARALQGGRGTDGPGGGAVAAGDGSVRVGVRADRESVLRGGDGLVKLELELTGADGVAAGGAPRVPTDLVVVLDRSGSMEGEPLAQALASVRQLVDSLGAEDRFALVAYASSPSTVIPLSRADADARAAWHRLIASLYAEGGTNMSSGLDLAAAQLAESRRAGRAARLVLVSDGHANEGDASREGLLARAARARSGEYVLSTVGVGHGFDEALMASLADAGTGNFYFVDRSDDLGGVFAGEFASARAQLASALAVEIEPAPGVEVLSASGYPLRSERAGEHGRVVFEPGPLYAGQVRTIWLTLRVPNDATRASHALGAVAVHYTKEGVRQSVRVDALPEVAVVEREEEYLAGFARDVWAASVAEDELGALKQSVAGALQRNDAPAALMMMRSFRVEKAELNEAVASPAVVGVLDALGAMEADVAKAAAPAAAPVRNELSKKYTAEAQDERRPGAKYGSK